MSLTAMAWLVALAVLVCLSFKRPVWAVCVYMLTYFMCPPYWWWGNDLPGWRWNYYAGFLLLGSVILASGKPRPPGQILYKNASVYLVLMLINAFLVHSFLAEESKVSEPILTLITKFTLLFFLLKAAVRTPADFRLVLWALTLGVGYLGYEVTVNDRGAMQSSRLEGVGVPGADSSNGLACMMVAVLPAVGALFFIGNKWEKLLVAIMAPLGINVLLLCNSRGAFLGLIFSAMVLLFVTKGQTRRRSVFALALAGVTLFMLMGDEKIFQRFTTTFAGSEERDSSAAGRLIFWKAGGQMIVDHPLGAGGNGFKRTHGVKYLYRFGISRNRAVHNGFINEACQWGIQGLVLRMFFFLSAFFCAKKAIKHRTEIGDSGISMLGACIVAGGGGFLICSLFGDHLDSEWAYWLAALMIVYAQIYGKQRDEAEEGKSEGRAASGRPLEVALSK